MDGTDPVERNPNIVEADIADASDVAFIDQGTIAGQSHIKAHVLGAMRNIEDVGTQKRLAA